MITCDNNQCEHNQNYICHLNNISVVGHECVSRRKRSHGDNYTELMKSNEPKGYKRGGKWIGN